jgi:hypothetical protein
MNAVLLESYRSNVKQNITRPVKAIIIEFTENAISDTGFTDKIVDRK